ncbi:MAG: hypothetical protein ACPGU4_11375 [Flavobacteriales bacterium]
MRPVIYWLFVFAFFLFSAVLFLPGSMGYDALSQWYQLNGIIPISDWHPPIMVHIWKFLNQFIEGPLSMLVLQLALYWCGLALTVKGFFSQQSNKLNIVVLAIIGFFPVTWLQLGSVWKDALMLSALLFAFGLFMHATSLKASGKKPYWIFLLIGLALVLSCGTRHNAFFAVIPLVCLMVFELSPKRLGAAGKLLMSGVVLVVTLFVSSQINRVGVEDKNPYLINQLVLWNVAGISVELDTMLVPNQAFKNPEGIQIEELKTHYSQSSNNSLVFTSGIINPAIWNDETIGKQFLAEGLQEIVSHPKAYLKIRLQFLKKFMGIGVWMPYMAYIFETKFWDGDDLLELNNYRVKNQSVLIKIEQELVSRMSHFGFYNVVPYMVALLVSLLYLIFKYKGTRRKSLIALGLSGVFYWLPYLIIAPSNDFRYHNWTILVTIIICSYLIVNGLLFKQNQATSYDIRKP